MKKYVVCHLQSMSAQECLAVQKEVAAKLDVDPEDVVILCGVSEFTEVDIPKRKAKDEDILPETTSPTPTGHHAAARKGAKE